MGGGVNWGPSRYGGILGGNGGPLKWGVVWELCKYACTDFRKTNMLHSAPKGRMVRLSENSYLHFTVIFHPDLFETFFRDSSCPANSDL